jgi:putative hemolysin
VDREFDLSVIQAAASCIPTQGALLVTSNHPTGIFDGVVLLAALLSRRNDIRIVANEALSCIPVLAERVIPIRKTGSGDRGNRHALVAIRRAWMLGECVIVFPAGTVAHWQWTSMQVADAPWNDSIQRFATKRGVPEYRARLSIKNPWWFHGCAAISRKARTALLLRAFLANHVLPAPEPIIFHEVGS